MTTKTAPNKAPAQANNKESKNSVPKVRIKIRAYDHKIIDQSTKTIIETALRSGAKIIGANP